MSMPNKTAFIVEGHREKDILTRVVKILPEKSILDVMIVLPAEMNIYMLWKDIKDDPDINIIDYLKEKSKPIRKILSELDSDDFSEIYLFFDLDAQQDNIKYNSIDELINIIKSMLRTFNNETEKGKMYISYPMCEAYSDYLTGTCKTFMNSCFLNPFDDGYKNQVGKNNKNAVLTHLDIQKVNEMISCYIKRLFCLFNISGNINYTKAKEISTDNIFDKQSILLKKDLIFVLSAFPEFLIDYYKPDVLKGMFSNIDTSYDADCELRL